MKINKEYRKGGFFGNSQDRFSDMEGAGQGINMAFASQGRGPGRGLGRGAALRREKRYLKKLDRQGKLNEEGPRSADRLEYLKKVQRDRIKKGIGAGALAAGAAFGAPALVSAVKGAGGLAGVASNLGSSKIGSAVGKGIKALKTDAVKRKALRKGAEALSGIVAGEDAPSQNMDERGLMGGMQEIGATPSTSELEYPDISGGSQMDQIAQGQLAGYGTDTSQNIDVNTLMQLLAGAGIPGGAKGMKILKRGQDKNEDLKLLHALKAMYGAKLPE